MEGICHTTNSFIVISIIRDIFLANEAINCEYVYLIPLDFFQVPFNFSCHFLRSLLYWELTVLQVYLRTHRKVSRKMVEPSNEVRLGK